MKTGNHNRIGAETVKSARAAAIVLFIALGSWTGGACARGFQLAAVTFGNTQFVGVGEAGGLAVSLDGLEWKELGACPEAPLRQVTSANGLFVAVGDRG